MDTTMQGIFSGLIRIHILYHAGIEEIYGVGIIEELERHGYTISSGTLYPILHELEKSGNITSRKEIVNGKIRKYYRLTKQGMKTFQKAKMKLKELVDEVVGG